MTNGRTPLTADTVFEAAMRIADEHGIDAVTMRRLAEALGVQAMSLYHHVPGREALLDGMVERVFTEIELPPADRHWRAAMEVRAASARAALARHPWSIALLDSRTNPGHATLRHHDAVLGCLRRSGFSVVDAGHAFALLDAYVYGFVMQEQALPFETPAETKEVASAMLAGLESTYPYLAEVLRTQIETGAHDFKSEFGFGLGLLLDGLTRFAPDDHPATQSGGAGRHTTPRGDDT